MKQTLTHPRHFEEWIPYARQKGICSRMAVAAAHDLHTLQSVVRAAKAGLVSPILIGDPEKISSLLNGLGEDAGAYELISRESPEACAQCRPPPHCPEDWPE